MAAGNDEEGTPVQIVVVNDDHTFNLNEEGLENILKDVKDLPMVVISIAGAMRQGKSFLLSFFIRYLRAKGTSDWLGDKNLPLKGFSWRGGCKADTSGILMWSQAFQVQIPSGQTVGVLLMDTQGAFDNNSTFNECATIFALSTLISSVQIFNIKDLIKENDLQNLQIFTEYGKLAMEDSGQKPFQKVLFLVRDWASEMDFIYGSEGGKNYIDKTLEVKKEQHAELRDVRRSIRACFEDISCFLMPHPGLEVAEANFEGRIADIEKEFVEKLCELAQDVLAPENLIVKTYFRQQIKAEQLLIFVKEYMKVFQAGKIPEIKSMFKATADAINMTAVTKAKELYQSRMDFELTKSCFCIEENKLQEFHLDSRRAALEFFQQEPKLSGKDLTDSWKDTLRQMLKALHIEFVDRNKETGVIEEVASRDKFSESLQVYKHLVEEKLKEKIRYSMEDLFNVHKNSKAAAVLQLENSIRHSVGEPTKQKLTTNLSEEIEKHYLDVQEQIKLDRELKSHSIEDALKVLKDEDPEKWRATKYQFSLANGSKPFIYAVEDSNSASTEFSAAIALAATQVVPMILAMPVVGTDGRVNHTLTGGVAGGHGGSAAVEAGVRAGAAVGGAIGGYVGGTSASIQGAAVGSLIGGIAVVTVSTAAGIVADGVRGKLTGRLLSHKCGVLELKPSFLPKSSDDVDQWFKIVLEFLKMVLNRREMFVLTWHDAEDIFIDEPLDYTIEKLDELSYFKARLTTKFLKDACTSPQFASSEMAFTSPTPNIVDAHKLRGCTKNEVLEGKVEIDNEYTCMTNIGSSLFWLNPEMTLEVVKSILTKNGSDILFSD